jgi:hypothetical protein
MKLRKGEEQEKKVPEVRRKERKPKLQVVKLEERIAPRLATNHNETLVGDPAKAPPKAPQPCKGGTKRRFRVDTLVRERSARAR